MKVEFTVPGQPRGKERPKFANGIAYTPKKTVEYENRIKTSYLEKYGLKKFDEEAALVIHIIAVFEPPASLSQVKKAKLLKSGFPTKKPDIDNICKVVMDAMNKLVYKDDKQVVAVSMQKTYGEKACVMVEVEDLE